jgi:hypothetical protein
VLIFILPLSMEVAWIETGPRHHYPELGCWTTPGSNVLLLPNRLSGVRREITATVFSS